MPLRDHFRPPLDNRRHWEGFHATWPVMMVARLHGTMPKSYYAEPWVQTCIGAAAEVPVTDEQPWQPPLCRPFTIAADLPAQDCYEVRVYDDKRCNQQVAAIEIVSPNNRDRRNRRRLFAAKCATLLQQRVSVVIVDIVTTGTENVYGELLDLVGHADPALNPESPSLYAVACRTTKHGKNWVVEVWSQPLALGTSLPAMPLWLADNLAVPLELEESYEQSCGILGIP